MNYKVGDKVTHIAVENCEVTELVEGWYKVKYPNGCSYIVRPSELEPYVDPATLKMRELCSAAAEERGNTTAMNDYRNGYYDNNYNSQAFVKYIRDNPPLTSTNIRQALKSAGLQYHESHVYDVHTALKCLSF